MKNEPLLIKTEDIQKLQELRKTDRLNPANFTPCNIGFIYMRMYVSGEFSSCCISPSTLGDGKKFLDWREAWFSSELDSFREITSRIHKESLHLKDPYWMFCNQCGHSGWNEIWDKQLKNPISPLGW